MKYLLMIYSNEADDAGQAMMAEYFAYNDTLRKRNAYDSAEALQPTATATTVRVRDGKTLTHDGPFAETKEQLGGYYLVEAKDLNEAIELAALCPGSHHGTIEIRPVVVFG
jgi:hypothetical protein